MVPIPLGQHLFDFCRHINRLTLQRTNCQCYIWMSLQSIKSVVIYLGRCLISYKGHHYQFPDSATWRGNIMKMKYLITVTSNGRHDVSNYRRFVRGLFSRLFMRTTKTPKLSITGSIRGKCDDEWCIPWKNEHYCWKRVHVMTSSWMQYLLMVCSFHMLLVAISLSAWEPGFLG